MIEGTIEAPEQTDEAAVGQLAIPDELEQGIRQTLRTRRDELLRKLHNRSLAIDVPEHVAPDEKLAKQIAKHNDAAATFDGAFADLEGEAGQLAAAMTDPKVSGAELAERAQAVRARQYDRAQERLGLLGRKVELLAELADAMSAAVADAERDLAKARDTARKKLRAAGVTVESMPAWPNNPKAAAHVLEHRVSEVADVQAAQAHVQNVHATAKAAGEMRRLAAVDAERIGEELLRTWKALTGRL